MSEVYRQFSQTAPIQSVQPIAPAQAAAVAPTSVIAQPQPPQSAVAQVVSQGQSLQVPNYSGVNIQIFNPSVAAPGASLPPATVNAQNYSTAPAYPQNYYTQNLAQPVPAPVAEKKKTEKREIVELTDEYVKNLEGYLNNQNKEVRLMGAKEVLARLQEDESRKDDPVLTALVNKMLQDPYQPVKFIAMAALETRAVKGDSKTVTLLQSEQKNNKNYGEDALKASNILLKMSQTSTQKEFEVKEKKNDSGNKELQGK